MSEGTQLVRYDAMCHAIAEAYAVDEVKEIRDKARAFAVYARLAHNTEAERQACEIRLRAERRCGQLLSDMHRVPGLRTDLTPSHDGRRSFTETREQAGISAKQAENWQKLADVSEDDFERAVIEPGATTAGIIAAHEPRRDVVDPMALWLWGRLQDFERDGLLDTEPAELFGTMLAHMQITTTRLAPRVAAWLRRIADEC